MNLQRATLNFQALSMDTDVLGTAPSKHTCSSDRKGHFLVKDKEKFKRMKLLTAISQRDSKGFHGCDYFIFAPTRLKK